VRQHNWSSQDGLKWKCELCEKIVRTVEGQAPEDILKQLAKISKIDRVVSAAFYSTAVQFQFENNSLDPECIPKKAL
jgi:hypothetical protein